MNALFRRDYLYEFNTDAIDGVNHGDQLRYLNYDRQTKSYVFLKGKLKLALDSSIKIKGRLLKGIKRLHWVGYGRTNNVVLEPSELATTRRVITHSDQLELGKVYQFSAALVCIAEEPLVFTHNDLTSLGSTVARFRGLEANRELTQGCLHSWINDGLVKCEVIE